MDSWEARQSTPLSVLSADLPGQVYTLRSTYQPTNRIPHMAIASLATREYNILP